MKKEKTKIIVLFGTLDTKGLEIGFVREKIQARGRKTIVVDAGVLGQPQVKADISREDVAQAGGKSLEELLLFRTPEGVDRESYIIATYLVEHDSTVDILRTAAALAVEQTTGTWTPVPGETPELRKKHVGRVVAVHEIPAYEFEVPRNVETRQFIVEIAFPWINSTAHELSHSPSKDAQLRRPTVLGRGPQNSD